MTKKEMVKELKSLGVKESESALKTKTNKELEKMINSYSNKNSEGESEAVVPDVEAMKAQMMADMREEMMAQAKEELRAEMAEKNAEDAKEEKTARKRVAKIDRDEQVEVMNITNGNLVYQSTKTGMEVLFEDFGDKEWLEVGELLTMRSSQRKFLNEPWILIMDEEVVNYLGLDKLYDKMIDPEKIDSVFKMPVPKFKEVIEDAPRGIAELIVSRARQKIEDGSLDSVSKIRVLNDKFDIDLQA